jgi:hypothetical protein
MPPMMAGTLRRSTSWRAWSTATEPWLCASRRSKARRQPATPCARLPRLQLVEGQLHRLARRLAEAAGRTR